METRMLVSGVALVCAFVGAYAASAAIMGALRRRKAALIAQGERFTAASLVAWRLRNGFPLAVRAAAALLKVPAAARIADEAVAVCSARGLKASREPVMSVLLVAALVVSAVAGAATGSAVGLLAAFACLAAVSLALAGNARDKREDAMRAAVPGAIESMAACLGSGFTLLQTFSQVAADVPGPLGETFARCAHILEMGGSSERALSELREGAHASELAFVAVALDVQHQSGGALRQVLDAASDSVKGELALQRSLRVQTAQAKLSARVVVVMPFVLVAAFSLASPDFLAPFFASPLGYALLALAFMMQAAGIALVRRALAVEGVS